MELNLKSGWAYCTEQIIELCKDLPNKDTLNILELGGGDSSIKLLNFFKQQYSTVNYLCYETDKKWAPIHEDIEVILYDTPSSVIFESKSYDLILVDGPTGISRKDWYSKLKDNVHPGTIIHIDDYDHYVEFEQELNKHIKHVELYRTPKTKKGEKSWLTVKII